MTSNCPVSDCYQISKGGIRSSLIRHTMPGMEYQCLALSMESSHAIEGKVTIGSPPGIFEGSIEQQRPEVLSDHHNRLALQIRIVWSLIPVL